MTYHQRQSSHPSRTTTINGNDADQDAMSVLKRTAIVFALTAGSVCGLTAQDFGQVRVEVSAANEAIADAEVVVNGTTTPTDDDGIVTIRVPPGDTKSRSLSRDSFQPPFPSTWSPDMNTSFESTSSNNHPSKRR